MSNIFPVAGIPHYTPDPPGIPLFCKFWQSSHSIPPEVTKISPKDIKYWNDDIEILKNETKTDWVKYRSPDLSKWIAKEELEKITYITVIFKMKVCVYAENYKNASGTILLRTPKKSGQDSDALCLAQIVALPGYPDGFAQREDIKYARVTLPIQNDFTFKWEVYNTISSNQPNYTAISCWLAGYYTLSRTNNVA